MLIDWKWVPCRNNYLYRKTVYHAKCVLVLACYATLTTVSKFIPWYEFKNFRRKSLTKVILGEDHLRCSSKLSRFQYFNTHISLPAAQWLWTPHSFTLKLKISSYKQFDFKMCLRTFREIVQCFVVVFNR